MSRKATWFRDRLKKKVKQGFQGCPIATVTYYGPDGKTASKVAVGLVLAEGGDVAVLERWYRHGSDIRLAPAVNEASVHFIQRHGVKSVLSSDRIFWLPP